MVLGMSPCRLVFNVTEVSHFRSTTRLSVVHVSCEYYQVCPTQLFVQGRVCVSHLAEGVREGPEAVRLDSPDTRLSKKVGIVHPSRYR